MAKQKIVVYIEGDLDEIAQVEMVSPDQIIDTLAHDIQRICDSFSDQHKLTSWVDDTFFINDVRHERGE